MSSPKVLIVAPPFAREDQSQVIRLRDAGFRVQDVRPAISLDDETLRRELADTWAIIPGNAPSLGREFFDLAPSLRVAAKMGVGLDNIDISLASARGVLVCNTPGANTGAVADYTLGLILALARRIIIADQEVRAGSWVKLKGLELSGRVLGLVGLGAIGRAVAQRALAFGMRVVAHDPFWPEEFANAHGVENVSVDELMARSDVISLHCPLTQDNARMINRRTLELARPSAFLINTARGALVDEDALAEILEEGRLAGAALDTFAQEPLPDSPLRRMENVILSPHTAWFTGDSMRQMTEGVVDQLIQIARGERPTWLVNPQAWSE